MPEINIELEPIKSKAGRKKGDKGKEYETLFLTYQQYRVAHALPW
ncbi:MAG: hypothetical protein WC785_04760 [Tatlockia sp.]|jgi:hypothetical protein